MKDDFSSLCNRDVGKAEDNVLKRMPVCGGGRGQGRILSSSFSTGTLASHNQACAPLSDSSESVPCCTPYRIHVVLWRIPRWPHTLISPKFFLFSYMSLYLESCSSVMFLQCLTIIYSLRPNARVTTMAWMFLCLPNSLCWNLMPNVKIWGGGTLGVSRSWGWSPHELPQGHCKWDPRQFPCPFCHGMLHSPDTESARCLDLGLLSPQNCVKCMFIFTHPVFGILL